MPDNGSNNLTHQTMQFGLLGRPEAPAADVGRQVPLAAERYSGTISDSARPVDLRRGVSPEAAQRWHQLTVEASDRADRPRPSSALAEAAPAAAAMARAASFDSADQIQRNQLRVHAMRGSVGAGEPLLSASGDASPSEPAWMRASTGDLRSSACAQIRNIDEVLDPSSHSALASDDWAFASIFRWEMTRTDAPRDWKFMRFRAAPRRSADGPDGVSSPTPSRLVPKMLQGLQRSREEGKG